MKKLIYTKYSNERARFCAIRTDILQDEQGARCVRKTACDPAGEAHISGLFRSYQKLSAQYEGTPICMNRCRLLEEGVELEYLKGQTLEEEIDTLLLEQKEEEAQSRLLSYLYAVRDCGGQTEFRMTEEFCRIFGNVRLPRGLKSLEVTDIDMVLSNVLVQDGWNLIDYEWTFEFPIPLSYVLFRIIHYYAETSDKRKTVVAWDLYEKVGIHAEEIPEYEEMEKHFQDYIQGSHVPMREMYEDISPGVLSVYRLAEKEHKHKRDEQLQVFYSQGEEFSEEHSLYYPMPDGQIRICLTLPAGTRQVRLDPCSFAGVLNIRQLEFIGASQKDAFFAANGLVLEGREQVIFDTMDPQLLIREIPEGTTALQVDFAMTEASEELAVFLNRMQAYPARLQERIAHLEAELAQRDHLIHEMEQTKVWRAYRKVKKITGKDQ